MDFLRGLVRRLALFMRGRNGMDHLGFASMILSFALQAIASLTGIYLLLIVSFFLYGYTFFRFFSKKSYQRMEENRRFYAWWSKSTVKIRQFWKRLRLSRQYKYFKCPQCKALLRISRGEGERAICCPKCQNRFRQKS